MPKHIHADLISEYARLSHITDKPWEYFQWLNRHDDKWWSCDGSGMFYQDTKYRLKPRTIKIGDMDISEPVREPLEEGTVYFLPRVYSIFGNYDYSLEERWTDCDTDIHSLERGLIHLDRESAELHAKALISLTQKKE
ncbi:hypothetical protein PSI23_19630 [Xenorhabdus sp. XENO-10]|uniref:Uncharacterized protein n=1 Tax=Xenorhabdus yunnanensis TaxID=3025878 RepID=A0ABT5LJY3_9GAMM|nr:hypothetical protein [Xenorhabdus yunnanensis]MDC9591431.1 hypothetical protein [Xenorhabdus yunnanensis]